MEKYSLIARGGRNWLANLKDLTLGGAHVDEVKECFTEKRNLVKQIYAKLDEEFEYRDTFMHASLSKRMNQIVKDARSALRKKWVAYGKPGLEDKRKPSSIGGNP